MSYRVYSAPRGSEMFSPMDKDKMLFKEFTGLDDAIAWAHHVNANGRTALLIEGDDGTRLTRKEITASLQHAERELS